MCIQISLKFGIMFHVVVILDHRRVFRRLRGDIRMAAEKSSETRHMPVGSFVSALVFTAEFLMVEASFLPTVLLTVKAIFLPNEGVGIFLYFLANSRVLLQIRLQRRVLLRKFPVVYQ